VSVAVAIEVQAISVGVAQDLAPLRDEWRGLNDRARSGNMFLAPEWLEPWWRHFGQGRELQLICVREGGMLIGLLPLFAEKVRLGGVDVRRLAFLGDGDTGCDYLDVLAEPGREREVLERCLEKLFQLPWDLCDLDGMWRESFTALHVARRFPPGRVTDSVVRDSRLRYVCPNIPLAGTYDEYLQGLGRRENLRRREKWIFRQPGTSIDCARSPQDAPAATERFLELHRARWAVEGGSDGLSDERHEAFHRDASQRLAASGALRMYTLYAARRPVASVYGVVHKGKFNYYQSGYDPSWASKSVGLVLLARTVSDAFSEGLQEFDFLRGNEGYKGEWARGERWTLQLRLWRGARGRAARAAMGVALFAREAVKAALPHRAVDLARKARRLLRAPRPEGESRLQATIRILQEP
jgi:CelD/BcsL family acetyltransferase involved in cellulose biosynthesis